MKTQIQGKNIEITKGIETAITESLSRVEELIKEEVNVHVIVRTYTVGTKIEVTLKVIGGDFIRQEVMHDDLYAAIDLVGKKLVKQIRKINSRNISSKKQNTAFVNLFHEMEEKQVTTISRRKVVENKPMTEEEALLQFELVGHNFYIFEDAISGITKILYLRKDKEYGILELEG